MTVVPLCLRRLLWVCPVSHSDVIDYTYYVSTNDGRGGGHHRGDWFCFCTNALAPKTGWGGCWEGMTGEVHKAAAPAALLKPCQAETTILLAHLLASYFNFFRLLLFIFPLCLLLLIYHSIAFLHWASPSYILSSFFGRNCWCYYPTSPLPGWVRYCGGVVFTWQ